MGVFSALRSALTFWSDRADTAGVTHRSTHSLSLERPRYNRSTTANSTQKTIGHTYDRVRVQDLHAPEHADHLHTVTSHYTPPARPVVSRGSSFAPPGLLVAKPTEIEAQAIIAGFRAIPIVSLASMNAQAFEIVQSLSVPSASPDFDENAEIDTVNDCSESMNGLDGPTLASGARTPMTLSGETDTIGHQFNCFDEIDLSDSLAFDKTQASRFSVDTKDTKGKEGKRRLTGCPSVLHLLHRPPSAKAGHGKKIKDTSSGSNSYWDEKRRELLERRQEELRRRSQSRRSAIIINGTLEDIAHRQEFILKLTRAFMKFGAPAHRLSAQMQATARALHLELSCIYLPGVMLLSFEDMSSNTSCVKFVRQDTDLDLGKVRDAYEICYKVIREEISVFYASLSLEALLQRESLYSWWQILLFGGIRSASLCSLSFSGSFLDVLVAFPLGVIVSAVRILFAKNESFANIFEITTSSLISYIGATLAGTHHFCYTAVTASSVISILPGFIILMGSLEFSSRNILPGAARLCYAILYVLFLGFGLSLGGTLYEKTTQNSVLGPDDVLCLVNHNSEGPWYQRRTGGLWAFLSVPAFSIATSLVNGLPWNQKDLVVSVLVSCVGWTSNHFILLKLPNRKDVSSAVGAFAVCLLANIYSRFFSGNAFAVMIAGIFLQIPSGLVTGGLFTFVQESDAGSATPYLSAFETALQLMSISIGFTVGLGLSLVLVFPDQSSTKRVRRLFSL